MQDPTPTKHFWLMQMLQFWGKTKLIFLYFLPTLPHPLVLHKNVFAPLLSSHWFCVYTCEYYTAFSNLANTILLSVTAHNKFNVAEWDTTIQ